MRHVTEEVKVSQALLAGSSELRHEDRVLLEDNLDCLKERLGALGCALRQRCEHMRTRVHELTGYQVCFLLTCSFTPETRRSTSLLSILNVKCLLQTELQLLQTAFIETKCQILQALAGAMDRPASKQLEVLYSTAEHTHLTSLSPKQRANNGCTVIALRLLLLRRRA